MHAGYSAARFSEHLHVHARAPCFGGEAHAPCSWRRSAVGRSLLAPAVIAELDPDAVTPPAVRAQPTRTHAERCQSSERAARGHVAVAHAPRPATYGPVQIVRSLLEVC